MSRTACLFLAAAAAIFTFVSPSPCHPLTRNETTHQAHHDASESPSARVDAILNETADQLWEFVGTYFHNGYHIHCIRLGHLIQRLDPHQVDAFADTAWLEWSNDLATQGERDLQRGVGQNPNGYEFYEAMGDYYRLWLKKPVLAYPYFLKAASFYDHAPWTVYGSLAHAAESAGDYTRAVIAWRMARIKAPNQSGVVDLNLRRVQRKLSERSRNRSNGN